MKKRLISFYEKVGLIPILIAALSLLLIIIAALTFPDQSPLKGWFSLISTFFSRAIQSISSFFGGSYGLGIIFFTLLIRFLILPLMIYQQHSMRKMQKFQPEMKEIQDKYKGKRDPQSMQAMQQEQRSLYQEHGINPYASMLPLLVQMPILMGLFDSINQTTQLREGTFLLFQLGTPDHTFILPILAALFTFISSWLAMQSNPVQTSVTKIMPFIFPVMIFFFALSVPSALSLYWVVSNAFQAVQTFVLQNPFKIRAERLAEEQAEKNHRKAVRRALNKANKRK